MYVQFVSLIYYRVKLFFTLFLQCQSVHPFYSYNFTKVVKLLEFKIPFINSFWIISRNESEALPRLSSPNFSEEDVGKPLLEVTLEPGDMFYFPRGFIHQASTVEAEHSLHITLSAYQKTAWVDLLEKVYFSILLFTL